MWPSNLHKKNSFAYYKMKQMCFFASFALYTKHQKHCILHNDEEKKEKYSHTSIECYSHSCVHIKYSFNSNFQIHTLCSNRKHLVNLKIISTSWFAWRKRTITSNYFSFVFYWSEMREENRFKTFFSYKLFECKYLYVGDFNTNSLTIEPTLYFSQLFLLIRDSKIQIKLSTKLLILWLKCLLLFAMR